MAKGKFGISLTALAILAFVLCFFGFTEVLVLLVAYAFLIEKDEWLTRQAFQALYLRIAYAVATTVLGWIFTFFNTFFGWIKAYGAITVMSSIDSFIDFLLYIALFVFALLAVIKVLKEKDAGLPGISRLADYTLGAAAKPRPQPAAPQPMTAPVYQAPVTQPQPSAQQPIAAPVYQPPVAQPQPAVQQPMAAPAYQPPVVQPQPAVPAAPPVAEAAETVVESAVAEPVAQAGEVKATPAEGYWICSCGRENFGNFCVSCGNPRKS